MRRSASVALVVAFVAALVVGVPSSASATDLPPAPVVDIPDIPSRTQATLPNTSNLKATDMWKNYLAQYTRLVVTTPAGTPTPIVSKPITAPTALARGAAGGPLVGSFLGGFAIGTAGLEVYGMITGDDPLDNLCGTPFEAAGGFLYMGSMPSCVAPIANPNPDVVAGTSATIAGYGAVTYKTRNGIGYWCGPGTQLAAGLTYRGTGTSGNPMTLAWRTSGSQWPAACGGALPQYASEFTGLNVTLWAVYRTSTGEVVASAPVQQTTGNPMRTPSCLISWKDGTTTTGTGTRYSETAGIPLSAPGLGCKSAWDAKPGAGREVMPDRIGVDSTVDGGAKTQIADQPVPEMGDAGKIALDPSLGNGRGLVLEKVENNQRLSCMNWEADCAQWWTTTSQGTTEGPYRCTFGGAPLSIGECGPYRHTFDTKTNTPTITDPATGTQTPWEAKPSTGNSLNPGTGPGTTPAQSCFDTGWASVANPVDWVLVPVKCALVWAFVPRTQVVATTTAGVAGAWNASTPGLFAAKIAAVSAPLAGLADASCGGLILAVPKIGAGWSVTTENRAFLAACPGDFFAPYAAGFFWFITAALIFGGFYAVKRLLDRFVGLS